MFTSIKEEINTMKSKEVNFQKSQKLLASRAGSSKQRIARMAFTYLAIEIEWIAIECSEYMPPPSSSLRALSVSSFCDFRKMTFLDLTAFFSFLTGENLVFSRYSY